MILCKNLWNIIGGILYIIKVVSYVKNMYLLVILIFLTSINIFNCS